MSVKKTEKKETLGKAEYERLSDFRYAIRKFLKFSESAAETVGLTPNQYQALLAIKGFPHRESITNGELAERLQIKHHSTVGLINRLVAQKLVRREQNSDDRREIYISLTESGEALLEQLAAIHREELRRLAPSLTIILEELKK